MKYFYYEYPFGGVAISEEDILKQYWDYWHGKMVAKFGPDSDKITKEKCIEDWVVIHWAEEITEERYELLRGI